MARVPSSPSAKLAALGCVLLLSACADDAARPRQASSGSGSGSGASGGEGVTGVGGGPVLPPDAGGPAPSSGGQCHTATDICAPGEHMPCWDGPPQLADSEACDEGTRYCNPWGSAFSGCQQQRLPAPDTCAPSGISCAPEPCLPAAALDLVPPSPAWSRGQAMASGPDGSFRSYSTGAFSPTTGFVEKWVDGSLAWTVELPKTSASASFRGVASLEPDAEGGVVAALAVDTTDVAAEFTGVAYALVSLAPDGSQRWRKDVHDLGATIRAVRIGPDQDIWIAGSYLDAIDLGGGAVSGTNHAYVARLDAEGAPRWVTAIDAEAVWAMTLDTAGRALVGGNAYQPDGRCDRPRFRILALDGAGVSQPVAEWPTDVGGPILTTLASTPDGGFLAAGRLDTEAGTTFDFGSGPVDGTVFAGRFTAQGAPVWLRTADVFTAGSLGSWLAIAGGDAAWVLQDDFSMVVRRVDAETGEIRSERRIHVATPVQSSDGVTILPDNGAEAVAILEGDRVAISGNFLGTMTIGANVTDSQARTLGFFLTLDP